MGICTGTVQNKLVSIYYETAGERNNPPLVLQHGLTDSLQGWKDHGYVNELEKDYFLILIDARGHGQSDKPHSPSEYDTKTFKPMAEDVVAVLDHIDERRQIHFVGYSMGGTIGFALARDFTDRLLTLTIVEEPANIWSQGKKTDRTRFDVHNTFTKARDTKSNDSIVELWRQLVDPVPGKLQTRLQKNDAQALMAFVHENWPDFTMTASALTVPCLLYAGMGDDAYPLILESANKMKETTTFVSRPQLNHITSFLETDLLLEALWPFLHRVRRSPPKVSPAR